MSDINMIQIHELNEASSVAATDVLAIDTGDATLKLKASKLTTGVKGNAESTYRTGNVNLTPANIGAVNKAGDTMTGDLGVSQAVNRVYLSLIARSDQPVDIRFSNENSAKWAISSRPSSDDNFLGLYNHMTNSFAVRVTNDNVVSLLKPLPVDSGGTGSNSEAGMRSAVLNSTVTTGITSYPTATGLYRTTGTLPAGMPTGANAYGVLMIVGAGTYYMHIYADAAGNVYIAQNGSTGAPATWRKVTTTNVTPIS